MRISRATLVGAIALITVSSVAAGPPRGKHLAAKDTGGTLTAQPIKGWLDVRGQHIFDQSGDEVILRGVDASGMEWGTGQKGYTDGGKWHQGYADFPDFMYDSMEKEGFNVARVPISWSNLEPNAPTTGANGQPLHTYNDAYLRDLDSIISKFHEHHIAVILSMHQWGWSPYFEVQKSATKTVHGNGMPEWLYQGTNIDWLTARKNMFNNVDDQVNMLGAAWQAVLRRFANNTTVIGADMLNEPTLDPAYQSSGYDGSKINLDDVYRTLGKSIRAADPHVALLFQTSRSTPVSGAPSFENVIFTFHSYPLNGWAAQKKWIKNTEMAHAANWNVPVWIGEYQIIGKLSNDSGPNSWQNQTTAMMQFCKRNNLGWSYWAWQRAAFPLAGAGGSGPLNQQIISVIQSGL